MDAKTVRDNAYAMPIYRPAYTTGPVRFCDRETLTITYKTDPDALRRVVPSPLEIDEPLVNFEVVHMPDSSGLGDYFESGQVIPVVYDGKPGGYSHMMFLNNLAGLTEGREIFGFPKKWGHPKLEVQEDCVVGTLDYGKTRVATATMAYKYQPLDLNEIVQRMSASSNFLLKIIPHIDGTPRICELVDYEIRDVVMKGAWSGPGALSLAPHALAPLADLPVLEIVGATHEIMDMTIAYGKVIHDYLK